MEVECNDKRIIVACYNNKEAVLETFGMEKKIKIPAYIGKNGVTVTKEEGDGKTPLGIFKFGIAFGTHSLKNLNINPWVKYTQINENLYWVDDINSKHYNKMVDITRTNKEWSSAEHLIKYPVQYEYAIEIKTNPKNIPNKR